MQEKLRTIIIDDEKEAREGLKAILQKEGGIEVVALCKNGLEAIQQIHTKKPDLVFLDIQMPEINGFEVLNSIAKEYRPMVAFVTAYDQFALKAFQHHAVDYILKPITPQKIHDFLSHLQQIQKVTKPQIDNLLQSTLEEKDNVFLQSQPELSRRKIIFKSMGKIHFLGFDSIIRIDAEGVYLNIITSQNSFLVRDSLKKMENSLPTTDFLRVNKSHLVNLNAILEAEPYFNGEYFLKMSNGSKVKVSRSFSKQFSKWLEKGVL